MAMMILGASFAYFQRFVGGDLLDMATSGSDAFARLGDLTAEQRIAHVWITLVPDSLYPIAYGTFFAGATLYLAASTRPILAVPALVTVVADFSENIVQILALSGHENLLAAKSVLTPLKFSAFCVMFALFLACAIFALIKFARHRKIGSDE
ncbi:MAG: hypothetical protein EX271_01965 [Acidimicrobiales bacterium]|nr:hypothetical protein [Hyphomonadaceae bacterium]RZV44365.1 MAG: hypothetical protein EX271_01965 [Acidimicrobiales bacterium]